MIATTSFQSIYKLVNFIYRDIMSKEIKLQKLFVVLKFQKKLGIKIY